MEAIASRPLDVEEGLSSTIQIRMCKFVSHVFRNEESMESFVVQGQVEGTRSQGRSTTRIHVHSKTGDTRPGELVIITTQPKVTD